MTSPPPIPAPGTPSVSELLGYKEAEVAIDGTVLSNRSCVKCAYNLLGLQQYSNCPECGTPVDKSLKGHLLRFASVEYLQTLATGFSLILNGILATCVAMGLTIISTIIISVLNATNNATITIGVMTLKLPSNLNTGLLESIGFLAQSLLGFIVFFGYIKVTSEDPGMTGLEYPRRTRTALKVAVIVQICATTVLLLVKLSPGTVSLGPGMSIAASVITVLSAIAWVVQFFSMMNYCKWLVSRIPDVTLIQKISKYTWQLPLVAVLLSCFFGLGSLIALIMYWELLYQIRKQLRQILDTNHSPCLSQSSAATSL